MRYVVKCLAFLLAVFTNSAIAGSTGIPNDFKAQSIAAISDAIETNYFDSQMAKKIMTYLEKQYLLASSNSSETATDFVRKINVNLQQVSGDGYINFYVKEPVNLGPVNQVNNALETKFIAPHIGYIKLNRLSQSQQVSQAIEVAVNELKHAEAVIVDLQELTSIDIAQAIYFLSHFLPNETEVVTFTSDQLEQPKRFKTQLVNSAEGISPNTPVYVLTSPFLSQGAELIAYSLQQHERALIVGKPTMGVSYWLKPIEINNSFILELPIAKATFSTSQLDWEGEGVIPDVDTDVKQSLSVALQLAKKQVSR